MLRIAVGILLLLLVGYGVTRALPLLSGPSLSIDSPINYTTSSDGFIAISGRSYNTETLMMNGGPLPIDPEGRFSTTLLLPEGGAIITLTATDRFGRSTTERRSVFIP